ncbi:hypothetical protein [Actinomadura rupiterrae]|uniref:hypothetical protein n=1 Tax=Actinomadura rupiterrae TaxID=559627 RepID=UPI0020A244C4|nr:hypothetical protein [Actinomadura rupiterrae]MCP2337505.1 hypothetical protein [Actinomadura rupiterrae]
MDIRYPIGDLVAEELRQKTFSTGSRGYRAGGKITVDGERYQVQAQAILIGSKGNPMLAPEASLGEMAEAFRELTAQDLVAKDFRTGRTGYYASGKIHAAGQRYQASVQAVRLD